MQNIGLLLIVLWGNCLWALPIGLSLYYNADNNALDFSGNANHGSLLQGATFAEGKFGQSFSFDGVNDVVSAGTLPNLDFSQSHSISFWVYLDRFGDLRSNAGNKRSILMAKENGYYGLQIQSNPYYDSLAGMFDDTKGWISYSMSYTFNSSGSIYYFSYLSPLLEIEQWHHVAVINNAETKKNYFYINGNLVQTTYLTDITIYNPNSGNLYLGACTNNCGYDYTAGRMDDVLLLDRAISTAELSYFMSGTIPEPGTIFLFVLSLGFLGFAKISQMGKL